MKNRNFILLLVAVILLPLSGCGPADNSAAMIAELNSNNAKRLGNLYALYQTQNKNEGPGDESEFKSFISGLSAKRLERAGVDPGDLDALFTSERDGQPFKIRYGLATRVRGPSQAVVFEAEGVGGMRQVGFTQSDMQEVDSAGFDKLWAGEEDEVDSPVDGRDAQR